MSAERGTEPAATTAVAGGSFADEAFAATAEAYASAPGSWEHAVQAAIARLFDFLATRAEQAESCLVGDSGTARAELRRRDELLDRFTSLLQPGFAAAPTPPPELVAEAIGGGIFEIVRGHALERRLGSLPEAAPDATIVALAPFMGMSGAIDLTHSTSS